MTTLAPRSYTAPCVLLTDTAILIAPCWYTDMGNNSLFKIFPLNGEKLYSLGYSKDPQGKQIPTHLVRHCQRTEKED